jgi:hypothetical protein
MRYEGSNPSLCTISLAGVYVNLSPAGSGRLVIALIALAVLAAVAWQTMEPGRFRSLTWILLGFFAFRVGIGFMRSR